MSKKMRVAVFVVAIGAALAGAVALATGYMDSRPSPDDLTRSVASGVRSGPQEAAFSDTTIGFDEYESAVMDHLACLESQGFRVTSGPILNSTTQRLEYTVTLKGGPEDGARVEALSGDCYRTHLSEIDKVWSALNAPEPGDLHAAYLALATCLRGKGFDAPVDPQPGDLRRFVGDGSDERFWDCADTVSADFRLPGFMDY